MISPSSAVSNKPVKNSSAWILRLLGDDGRVEGERGRRDSRRRIIVGERTVNGADQRRRGRRSCRRGPQGGNGLARGGTGGDVGVACHRADQQIAALDLDAGESLDLV